MLEVKPNQKPADEGGVSFKTGLLIYVVSEAIAIGALVYHLLQR